MPDEAIENSPPVVKKLTNNVLKDRSGNVIDNVKQPEESDSWLHNKLDDISTEAEIAKTRRKNYKRPEIDERAEEAARQKAWQDLQKEMQDKIDRDLREKKDLEADNRRRQKPKEMARMQRKEAEAQRVTKATAKAANDLQIKDQITAAVSQKEASRRALERVRAKLAEAKTPKELEALREEEQMAQAIYTINTQNLGEIVTQRGGFKSPSDVIPTETFRPVDSRVPAGVAHPPAPPHPEMIASEVELNTLLVPTEGRKTVVTFGHVFSGTDNKEYVANSTIINNMAADSLSINNGEVVEELSAIELSDLTAAIIQKDLTRLDGVDLIGSLVIDPADIKDHIGKINGVLNITGPKKTKIEFNMILESDPDVGEIRLKSLKLKGGFITRRFNKQFKQVRNSLNNLFSDPNRAFEDYVSKNARTYGKELKPENVHLTF